MQEKNYPPASSADKIEPAMSATGMHLEGCAILPQRKDVTMGKTRAAAETSPTNGTQIEDEPTALAIETSSRIGSVAIARGGTLLDHLSFSAPLRHSAEILPAIGQLLHGIGRRPDDIDQVYLASGPGSFTGLRIAVTIAKSMNLANHTRIITIDALDVIAANVKDAPNSRLFHEAGKETSEIPRIATLLDAKRGQFFVAVYDHTPLAAPESGLEDDPGYRIPAPGGFWHKTLPDCLMTASALLDYLADGPTPVALLGDGLLYHRESFQTEGIRILDPEVWSPRATNVFLLGHQKACAGMFSDPLTLAPFYLRGPQVTLKPRP